MQTEYKPSMISDFFGMIHTKNIFSLATYDFENECDPHCMKFSEVGDIEHPYNDAYIAVRNFSSAVKRFAFRSKYNFLIHDCGYTRLYHKDFRIMSKPIIHDVMSNYNGITNNNPWSI